MEKKDQLNNVLKSDGIIIAPGIYNSITAKIAESIGFKVVYLSGSSTSTASFRCARRISKTYCKFS
jgi:2-methylisocitrate lyase-like PEP mutase family enzyme